ncbi:MAG: aminotransferase class IV, partial [Gammaproteobacteria bacterium]
MAEALATAYLDGEFLPTEEARISPLDRGFLFGDGVYEVIPVRGGKPLLLDAHIRRLGRSLSALRIEDPYPESRWRELVAELTTRNGGGDLAVYLQVTRGTDAGRAHVFPRDVAPTVFGMASRLPHQDYADGVAAITLPDDRWKRCDIKATALLANVLACESAQRAGAAEAILLSAGEVTEGAASSVLIVESGEVVRRPHGTAVLPGTTTDFVVEVVRAAGLIYHEQAISEKRLRTADEIWLTSATKGIVPVVRLDGQPVGAGTPGTVWLSVSQR